MMGGFIFLVLDRSVMEGSLRGGAGCCSADACLFTVIFQVLHPSLMRLRVKLTPLAAAGVGFSSLLKPLLPQDLSSFQPVIC